MSKKMLLALVVPAVMLLSGVAPASADTGRPVPTAEARPAKAKVRAAKHRVAHAHRKAVKRHRHSRHHRRHR